MKIYFFSLCLYSLISICIIAQEIDNQTTINNNSVEVSEEDQILNSIDDLFTIPDETSEADNSEDQTSNSIDDLFTIPDETADPQQAEQSQNATSPTEEVVNFDTLLQSTGPEINGNVSLTGGIIAGFHDWDFPLRNDGSEHVSAYYSLGLGVSLNVRISPELRAFASFSVGTNQDASLFDDSDILDAFTNPIELEPELGPLTVGEVFIDYTLLNTLFFRIGVQSTRWGQGRLSNSGIVRSPTNLLSFRVFIPLGNNGFTLFIYPSRSADINDSINLLNFAYAGLFEFILGPFSIGTSIRFHRVLRHALATNIYIKTAFLGIDFAVETRVDFDTDRLTLQGTTPAPDNQIEYYPPQFSLITNLAWANSDIGLRIFGEYQFNYTPNSAVFMQDEASGHVAGLGFALTKLFPNGWNPSVNWVHNFIEESGIVTVGIGGSIAPHVSLNISLPMIYGRTTGIFWRNNPDPQRRVVSLRVELRISAGF